MARNSYLGGTWDSLYILEGCSFALEARSQASAERGRSMQEGEKRAPARDMVSDALFNAPSVCAVARQSALRVALPRHACDGH